MTSANLNRYIKEYLKKQPKTLSMSQIEELIEYDAWLDTQNRITQREPDVISCAAPDCEEPAIYTFGLCSNHAHAHNQ